MLTSPNKSIYNHLIQKDNRDTFDNGYSDRIMMFLLLKIFYNIMGCVIKDCLILKIPFSICEGNDAQF